MDFYEKMGVLAIESRLRRLTDRLISDDVKMYKLFGLDFKPKWFPLFATLMDNCPHMVTAIAKDTGLSHSSVSVMAKEMQKHGLLTATQGQQDRRNTELQLTDYGREQAMIMQRVMFVGERSFSRMLNNCTQNLLIALGEWERMLDEKSLLDRIKEDKAELEKIK